MANHASIPASRTQEQYDKAEMTLEDEPCPPRSQGVQYAEGSY